MTIRARFSLDRWLPAGLALGLSVVAACSMEFSGEQKSFGLSESTREILHGEDEAQAALLAELERLFGTATHPAYTSRAASWNASGSLAGAPADLTPDLFETIRAGNRKRFEAELAEIQAGDFDSLGPWTFAPELSEAWTRLLDEKGDSAEFATTARTFFVDHYPSLRDSAALYGNKCLHCHGNEGGGDGPTSYTARPFPRDFRLGIFKYDNLAENARPERSDLVSIIAKGIYGTAMPSLAHLSAGEIHGLADYVRFLAIRGDVERRLALEFDGEESPPADEIDGELDSVFEMWAHDERRRIEAPPPIEPTKESIRAGYELFHDVKLANCASCHGTGGQGGGPAAYGPSPEDPDEIVPLLLDAWGHEARPADLVNSILRHGEDPRDLYERVYLGIDGTPMAGLGGIPSHDGGELFEDADLWSLVHYVQALRDPHWAELLKRLDEDSF